MKATEEQDGDGVFQARLGLGLRELDGLERVPDVSADVLRRLEQRKAVPERSPHRWLVLLAALLAIAVTATLLFQKHGDRDSGDSAGAVATQSQDPVGPWRLVYDLLLDDPARPPADNGEQSLEQRLVRAVGDLQRRVGALAVVTRGDGTTVTVVFANAAAGDVASARALLENPGRLEMRAVADADYVSGQVRFDMAKERLQLQAWLDGGGRERLQRDRGAIAEYRPASENLRWFVRLVRPNAEKTDSWGDRYVDYPSLAASTVAAHAESEWNGGTIPVHILARPDGQRFLVELVSVNLHERHFRETDLDPTSVVQAGPAGTAVVSYRLRADLAADYANFSEKYLGKCCAVIWNDEVLLAPAFRSRIPGVGQIQGLSAAQTGTIARILATPVAARLRFLRSERDTPR